MCGRYFLAELADLYEEAFGAAFPSDWRRSWNITPGRPVVTLRRCAAGDPAETAWMEWGMLPPWATHPGATGRQINARSESAAHKPMFRDAFRRRRCLIPADGFYEWRRDVRPAQPFAVRCAAGQPIAFAGLWQRLRTASGQVVESCAILTEAASPATAAIHPRVPVMLDPACWQAWLDPETTEPARLQAALRSLAPDALDVRAVGQRVSDPRHDDKACLAGAPEAVPAQGSLF
ncbi:SOS response-associated peptidase [Marinivivus vitaminiproducens]|uniref:SOS response-associated peptidase n=1 Tax=Marinivivus vitaminiproducens TaxID=3035935 RepID=UPI0027A0AFF1|nr:SOS response-associated peptidase [Geminicoccaceae bacterium SCSIO 64248]